MSVKINELIPVLPTKADRILMDKISTPWREANARKRGDRYLMPIVKDASERTVRTDADTGNKVEWRGQCPWKGR